MKGSVSGIVMVHMVGTGIFIGHRGVPSVPRYFEKPVPEGTERTPVFREVGTGGYRAYPSNSRSRYRAYPGISRGGYQGLPSVLRHFEKPVPGVPKSYRGTGTGLIPAVTGVAVLYRSYM